MNKQQRWQSKQIANGNCIICGKKAVKGGLLCAIEIIKRRIRERERKGCGEWVKGDPGRPQKYFIRNEKEEAKNDKQNM